MQRAAALRRPAVEATLSTAATLLGMEVVFIGAIEGDEFSFERVHGDWPGVTEGVRIPAADSLCYRMLAGAPPVTEDAGSDPHYQDVAARNGFGITSYVGVPIVGGDGRVLGTLCGIDHRRIRPDATVVGVLTELARIVAAELEDFQPDAVVIRRTPQGWQVAGECETQLVSAMALADLLAEDLAPGPRPSRPVDPPSDELAQLRLSVHQLEHALAARVVVEQAIGVLTERQHVAPRAAFDRLRKAARSRGRRVHDLAREVVASATDHTVPLPPELAGPR